MVELTDQDTLRVIALLREALASSGLSQAGFARALGTSAPRISTYLSGETRLSAHFLIRAQRLGRALGTFAERQMMSAPATATAMRAYLLAGEMDWVWRMLLQGRDHLALGLADESDQAVAGAWEAEPATTGSMGWDALLAALAAHEFERAGLAAPAWALGDPLTESWMPEHPFLGPERIRAQTPDWLRRRNIYVPERDLVTA